MSKNDKLTRAVIYTRTASSQIDGSSSSTISQIKECNEYAEKHNLKIDLVFSDVGVSGSVPLEKRDKLNKAVAYCKSNKISLILVSSHRRIASDPAIFANIKATLKRKGVNLLPDLATEEISIK